MRVNSMLPLTSLFPIPTIHSQLFRTPNFPTPTPTLKHVRPLLHHTFNMLASILWICLVGSLWSPACGFSPSTQAPRTSRHISLSVATPTRIEFDHALQNEGRDDDDDPFTLLSTLAATTLLQSDRRRDAIGKDAGAQASSGEFFQNTFDFVNVIYS